MSVKIAVEVVEAPKVAITIGNNAFRLTEKETKELVEALSKAGYRTGVDVKTHVTYRGAPIDVPLREAFDMGYAAGHDDSSDRWMGRAIGRRRIDALDRLRDFAAGWFYL